MADRFYEIAIRLIEKYGVAAEFVSSTATYDPTTGSMVGGTVTTMTTKVSPPEQYAERLIDGDVIRSGDMNCLVAGLIPVNGMKATTCGYTFSIVSFNPLISGGGVVCYGIQLRRI